MSIRNKHDKRRLYDHMLTHVCYIISFQSFRESCTRKTAFNVFRNFDSRHNVLFLGLIYASFEVYFGIYTYIFDYFVDFGHGKLN